MSGFLDRPKTLARLALRYRMTVLAGLLVLVALWEITVLALARYRAPSDDDWKRASAWVHKEHRAHDLIVFAPSWVDPVGRLWLGDLLTIDDAARMDAARYARIWEVSIRGASAPEARGLAVTQTESFGAVRVRRFEQTPARVVWDLAPHSDLYEVDFAPHECALLLVRLADQPAHLVMADATLGDTLHVYAGIADFRTRRDNRATGQLRVLVDDKEVAHAEVTNDSGWAPLPVIPTTPGVHKVELVASTEGMSDRIKLDVCVAAEARQSR